MATPDYWRQLDLIAPEELTFPVSVIGAGGIGSPVTLALAKMGCSRITVFDPDLVEQHNLPNQLYRPGDVGRPKVEALREIVAEFTGCELTPVPERVGAAALAGVVVSAVDSMSARAEIWAQSIRYRAGLDLYIDARMGAEVSRLYSVRPTRPDDVRFYESSIYSDETAVEEPCTAQAVIYNVLNVAGLVANAVKRFARTGEVHHEIIFDFATLTLLTTSTIREEEPA